MKDFTIFAMCNYFFKQCYETFLSCWAYYGPTQCRVVH